MSKTYEKHAITVEFAQQLVEAAVAKAHELKVPQCVAVVDDGGNLKAFVRMDGAALIPIEIAQSKAYTALFGFPTHEFSTSSRAIPRWSRASRRARAWRLSAAATQSKSTATSVGAEMASAADRLNRTCNAPRRHCSL